MAQEKPERRSVEEILKLVEQLTPEEQEQLQDEMDRQWLRKALEEGEESYRRDGGIPAEEVFAELRERAQERLRQSQK